MYSEGLYGLKDDAMRVAKIGVGIGLGIAGAKVVDAMVPAFSYSEWVKPVVLIGAGAAVYGFGKDKSYAAWTSSFAAGWTAVGLGKLIGAALDAAGAAKDPAGMLAKVKGYVPFAGVDTYDTGLLAGLGYGGYNASVSRYMMAGSPTQVQQLMGAPLQVQQLAGLGSSVLNGASAMAGAPMSATLV